MYQVINQKSNFSKTGVPSKALILQGFPEVYFSLFITLISFSIMLLIINILINLSKPALQAGFSVFKPLPYFHFCFCESLKRPIGAGFGASYQNLRNALLVRVSGGRSKFVVYYNEVKRQVSAKGKRIFRANEMLTDLLFRDQKSGALEKLFSAKKVCGQGYNSFTENRSIGVCYQIFKVANKKQTAGTAYKKLSQ